MPERRLPNLDALIITGSILLIVMGTLPILFSFNPSPTGEFFAESPFLGLLGKALTVLGILVIVFLIAKLDSSREMWKFFLYGGFLLLSYFLTDFHYHTRDVLALNWQADQYIKIIIGQYEAPHQYRFVPHGILWWILLVNGDFLFSNLAYRLFFTFVVCLCLYKFSRLYNSHKESLYVVLFYAIFYPFSIRYYYGNILDPIFHSVFIMSLMYCQKKKFWQVVSLVSLGMFIKETIILVVPCYYLLNITSLRLVDRKLILKLSCLIGWCLLLFLACRIPFGFGYNLQSLNGVGGLMILDNFGFPHSSPEKMVLPVYVLYLHPILFIFMWFPILVLFRRFLQCSLYYSSLYLGVSIYLTNLCFGWNYESRNFIPALSILLVSMVVIFKRYNTQEATEL